jgi:predicted SAM-dependent methyltransferase
MAESARTAAAGDAPSTMRAPGDGGDGMTGFARGVLERLLPGRGAIRGPQGRLAEWRRRVAGVDRKLVQSYFAGHSVRKLHVGCGCYELAGWLNADLTPESPQILRLDATKPFPFPGESFDYIFSEHMIEHIPFSGGLAMLRECHRVLRPHGRLRIATPDLLFLIQLYGSEKTETQRRYIEWSTQTWLKSAPEAHETFVINNFVRNWGHQFIYDERTLSRALASVGFVGITSHRLKESGDALLRDLEHEGRMPGGLLQLESLTLEATKA